MKKFLLLAMLLISYFSFAQDAKEIIGNSIKIEKFEVAQNDFPIGMNWDDAKAECAKLGNGWRLPTKNELNVMYKNKEKIGGFAHKHYWSSTEFDNFSAWRQNFYNGIQINFNKDLRDYPFYVRAVRTF